MSTLSANIFVYPATSLPPQQHALREFKYCIACRGLFARPYREQKGSDGVAHRVGPTVCRGCTNRGMAQQYDLQPHFESAAEREKRSRQQELEEAYREERDRYKKHPTAKSDRKSNGEGERTHRGRCWARWREPLLRALRTQGQMTSAQVGEIVGCYGALAVTRARSAGIPIIVVGHAERRKRGRTPALYGLQGATPNDAADGGTRAIS